MQAARIKGGLEIQSLSGCGSQCLIKVFAGRIVGQYVGTQTPAFLKAIIHADPDLA